MWNFLETHKYGIIIFAITVTISMFIGELGFRLIKDKLNQEIKHDTLYIRPSKSDSLLEKIASDVKEINAKIPKKKPVRRRCIPRKDTIRLDATIRLDKVGE